ncbi:hypothetical protein A3D03_03000 [Candidatus Gottesmanbacteria bacterium RIFCSPHIGHO2_02_FULL_40_13]|uniref:Cohesin domain-containing protein n=1 Tax=Candidatus Gottesmanbacteria bacterium RIFCSPHIGHO2_02_FULL_40_13 TaxID=1798384 RepID=A0A1F6AAJ4_9BACT|nr:MAG: hypothetical protein A3D03_03000 [Candidatus Gottesmanbacteria bacterium RIFCSPHIGHO2_02_FULL_40_13]
MLICRINLCKRRTRNIFTGAVLSLVFIFTVARSEALAQYFTLQLSDGGATVACGQSFQTKILINTTGEKTVSADALIKYDPTKVKINIDKSVKGDFYTYFSANPLGGANDKALISSWEESIAHEKSSTTDTLMATLDMTPLSTGNTTLSFDCVGTTGADSNINRSLDFSDIIKCADNKPLTFTITGTDTACGTTPTSTPSATLTPAPTSTPSATPTKKPTSTPVPTNTLVPTVSILPNVGSTKVTLAAVGLGLILTIVGILFIV